MILTLNTAKQHFHKTLQLMNMHCQTKLQFRTYNRNSHIWLYAPKFSYCDLDLEDRNPFFAYDALAYNDVSPYWVWLQMVQQCISSKLTLTETFNLGCDIDPEHSNPTFSVDTTLLMMIYTQIEFGCKRLTGLELIKYFDYISPHCDLDLEERIHFFCMTFRLMVVHHNTKFVYKRLQITLSPVETNMCHKCYIPHPWRHHSTFLLLVK